MKLGYNEQLPIFAHRDEIVKAIKQNEVVIVVGETGSGKSTQIPKMILEALAEVQKGDPDKLGIKIACTQPRRIAATSIAMRIAEEMEVKLSAEVGYKIRFDDESTRGTLITICTDGILLQEMKADNLLRKYNAILVDEAHERNLNIDFLLGLLKQIHQGRKKEGLAPLKILVTSATVDASKFANFFRETNGDIEIPVINVSGRLYPVNIKFKPVESGENIFYGIADLVKVLVSKGGESGKNDILIFMPGESEIFSTIKSIEYLRLRGVKCLPLYSRLSMDDQQLIYKDFPGMTKIVVATNIAETSLTVPGIRYVIDSGVARMTDFNFRTGIGSLEIQPISQAAAIQRAGRAGRVQEGDCYRLFSEDDFLSRKKYTVPEIQRSDLASVVLHMILIGIKDIYNFEFIDPPDAKAFSNAFRTLHDLGALDNANNMTEIGLKMAHLPLEPRISAMLLAAEKYNAVREIAVIASALSVKDPFLRPKDEEEEADAAKRYFQRLVRGERKIKILKVRKGRKIVTKKVALNSHDPLSWTSDLVVFLAIWNKFGEQTTEAKQVEFCKRNYLNLLALKEIEQIYHQLIDTLRNFASEEFEKYISKNGERPLMNIENKEGIIKAIASGLIQNLLEYNGKNSYKSRSADNIFIHPSSALFGFDPKWMVSAEIVETTKFYARNNTVIDPAWLEEVAAWLCDRKFGEYYFDKAAKAVFREESVSFRGMKIVEDRLANALASDDEALKVFIREALVNEKAIHELDFLKSNRVVRDKMREYFLRSDDSKFDLNEVKLMKWYFEKIERLGARSVDLLEFEKKISGKENSLIMKVEDFIDQKFLAELDKKFPKEIYLNGKKHEVRYFKNHFKFADGPAISISFEDLQNLDEEKLKKAFAGFGTRNPLLLVCDGGDFLAPQAMGQNIDEIKHDYDQYRLRKSWKIARKKYQVKGIGRNEILEFLNRVMKEVEIGTSLFYGKGELAVIYGYSGLELDGRKFAIALYENAELAWKNTMLVMQQVLRELIGEKFDFDEESIEKLERIYNKYFSEIDLKGRMIELLWQVIDLDGELLKILKDNRLDFGNNVALILELLNKLSGEIELKKKKVIRWIEEKLNFLIKLDSGALKVDKFELMEIRDQLQRGKID